MTITPELLLRWAQGLCNTANADRAAALALLALPDPPPPDITRVKIDTDDKTQQLRYVAIDIAPPGLSLGALRAVLGPDRDYVRFHAKAPFDQWFPIKVPGAPCTCDVFATFPTKPSAESTSTQLMLRYGPSPAPT